MKIAIIFINLVFSLNLLAATSFEETSNWLSKAFELISLENDLKYTYIDEEFYFSERAGEEFKIVNIKHDNINYMFKECFLSVQEFKILSVNEENEDYPLVEYDHQYKREIKYLDIEDVSYKKIYNESNIYEFTINATKGNQVARWLLESNYYGDYEYSSYIGFAVKFDKYKPNAFSKRIKNALMRLKELAHKNPNCNTELNSLF